MTTAQVVETSVTKNSIPQDYPRLDDHRKHITVWDWHYVYMVKIIWVHWSESDPRSYKAPRDSNPWPPRYRCDALPTKLWSLVWKQVSCKFNLYVWDLLNALKSWSQGTAITLTLNTMCIIIASPALPGYLPAMFAAVRSNRLAPVSVQIQCTSIFFPTPRGPAISTDLISGAFSCTACEPVGGRRRKHTSEKVARQLNFIREQLVLLLVAVQRAKQQFIILMRGKFSIFQPQCLALATTMLCVLGFKSILYFFDELSLSFPWVLLFFIRPIYIHSWVSLFILVDGHR